MTCKGHLFIMPIVRSGSDAYIVDDKSNGLLEH